MLLFHRVMPLIFATLHKPSLPLFNFNVFPVRTLMSDLFLGRVFGYLVLQQAGYFKSAGCLSEVETVIEGLLEVLDKKSYLQDVAASALAAIIIDVDR